MLEYRVVKRDNRINQTEQAYSLLRDMLVSLNMDFGAIEKSEHGKPYFKDLDIKFNYSHSKEHILIAISDKEIGVDIEEKNRVSGDEVSKKYLNSIQSEDERLKCWVTKEAYGKFLGTGITTEIGKLKIQDIKEEKIILDTEEYYGVIIL